MRQECVVLFYVPYALNKLAIPESTIGLFIAVSAASGVASNFLWIYAAEKYGERWILILTSAMACASPLVVIIVQYLPRFGRCQSTYQSSPSMAER